MSKSNNRSSLLDLTRKPLAPPAQTRVPLARAEEIFLETSLPTSQAIPEDTLPDSVNASESTEVPAVETFRPAPDETSLEAQTGTPLETPRETFPETPPATRLKPKQLSRRVAWSLKIEPELLQELRAVAEFNRLVASDIVHEALERHLKHFRHPPEEWQNRR